MMPRSDEADISARERIRTNEVAPDLHRATWLVATERLSMSPQLQRRLVVFAAVSSGLDGDRLRPGSTWPIGGHRGRLDTG